MVCIKIIKFFPLELAFLWKFSFFWIAFGILIKIELFRDNDTSVTQHYKANG